MEKRFKEIIARKQEIRSLLKSGDQVDLKALETELLALDAEEVELRKRQDIANGINIGDIPASAVVPPNDKPEQRGVADPFESIEYRKAFMDYALKGTPIPAEFRSDAITATTDVGAVIPTTTLNKIIEKITASGMILPLVTQTAYKGGVAIPTSSVKPVATWVAEGAGSETQKKTAGSITFAYHKLRCAVAVTLETDTMALSAFEASLIKGVSEAMVIALEQAIISGDGNGKPKGIVTETAVDGQAIEVAAFDYATLNAIEAAVPIEYEVGGVYVMTKKTFAKFTGMVDSNKQPISRVTYGITGAPERTLLGRRVILCNYLPSYDAAAAGAVFAFIFRFEDYVLNTNYAMTMKKYEDNLTEDQVTKAIMIADGKVVDKGSLILLEKPVA